MSDADREAFNAAWLKWAEERTREDFESDPRDLVRSAARSMWAAGRDYAALEAVNDGARLLGLIDGIGRIAERRMGICPLCDEHWNRHGMACPVRPALDAPAAVAGEAAVEQDCPSCGESRDKHITICTKDAQMVPIPHNSAAAPAQIHMPTRRHP